MRFMAIGPQDRADKESIFPIMDRLEMSVANKGDPLTGYVSLGIPGTDAVVKKYAESISLPITIYPGSIINLQEVIDICDVKLVIAIRPTHEELNVLKNLKCKKPIRIAETTSEDKIKYSRQY